MYEADLLKYFMRTHQMVGEEVDHTESWKSQFRAKRWSQSSLLTLTFTGGGVVMTDNENTSTLQQHKVNCYT
jgi:hypothetical protein